jgi:hypothetical protein
MSLNGEGEGIQVVNFDDGAYDVESLTPRVVEGFNMLVKLQNEIVELSYQLKKSQAAQIGITNEIKINIKTDKIKIIEPAVELESGQEELT